MQWKASVQRGEAAGAVYQTGGGTDVPEQVGSEYRVPLRIQGVT